MARTQKYLNHLLQGTGITPACSEEERTAADMIAGIFKNHGFEPEIQEFSASASAKVSQAVIGSAVFLGALFMGLGGAIGVIGFLLAVAAAVVYGLERSGKPVLSRFGRGGLSQNVIAYHKAAGPMASPRNRPVVVVAHYDSPRADFLAQAPFADYRPLIAQLLPYASIAPAIVGVLRLLPLPGWLKVLLWVVALLGSLVPLANAVSIFANRFVLPYTSGSVCNKSSVAAMLGVMDAVAPYKGEDEFPDDKPYQVYMREQRRLAAAMAAAQRAEQGAAIPRGADKDAPAAAAASGASAENAPAAQVQPPLPVVPGAPAPEVKAPESAGADETSMMSAAEISERAAQVEADAGILDHDLEPAAETAVDQPEAAPVPKASVQDSVSDDSDREAEATAAEAPEPAVQDEETPSFVNAEGNYRYGPETLRSLGMVSDACVIEYEPGAGAPEQNEESGEEIEDIAEPMEGGAESHEDGPAPASAPSADVAPAPDQAAAAQPAAAPAASSAAVSDSSDADRAPSASSGGDRAASTDDASAEDSPAEDDVLSVPNSISSLNEEIAREEAARAQAARAAAARAAAQRQAQEARANRSAGADKTPAAPQESHDASRRSLADRSLDELDLSDVDKPVAFGHTESPDTSIEEGAGSPVPEGTARRQVPGSDQVATAPADAAPSPAGVIERGSTQVFDPLSTHDGETAAINAEAETVEETVTMTESASVPEGNPAPAPTPRRPIETVESLMAQIDAKIPAPKPAEAPVIAAAVQSHVETPVKAAQPASAPRQIPPVVPDASALQQRPAAPTGNRSSLFDIPDPSVKPHDPFASDDADATMQQLPTDGGFSVIDSSSAPIEAPVEGGSASHGDAAAQEGKGKKSPVRGLRALFSRKKKQQDSMSDWLGVDKDFNAKESGGEIGSWDNFESDDDGWKGGATSTEAASEDDLRETVASLGDDELLGHDIWFVATGASELGNAGVKEFLATHRDKLRGVFLINLESVGAGRLSMVSSEGDSRLLKGDRRIMKLVQRVSSDFHRDFATVSLPYMDTDAHPAMEMSLRALTIAGMDQSQIACSYNDDDQPLNVSDANVQLACDVVTEVIRRS